MALVTRKDKLLGLRSAVDGGTTVILAFVSPRSVPRAVDVGFGVASVAAGLGQFRGSKLAYRGGVTAMGIAAVTTITPPSALVWPRSRRSSMTRPLPSSATPPPRENSAPEIPTTFSQAARGAVKPPAPGDKFRGARSIVSGSIALALAAEPKSAPSQRLTSASLGVVQVLSGVAYLRSSARLKLAVAYSHIVLLPVALVLAVARGVRGLGNR